MPEKMSSDSGRDAPERPTENSDLKAPTHSQEFKRFLQSTETDEPSETSVPQGTHQHEPSHRIMDEYLKTAPAWLQSIVKETGAPGDFCTATLYASGEASHDAVLRGIRSAEKSITIHMFSMEDGEFAEDIAHALLEAKQAGKEVSVTLSAVGTFCIGYLSGKSLLKKTFPFIRNAWSILKALLREGFPVRDIISILRCASNVGHFYRLSEESQRCLSNILGHIVTKDLAKEYLELTRLLEDGGIHPTFQEGGVLDMDHSKGYLFDAHDPKHATAIIGGMNVGVDYQGGLMPDYMVRIEGPLAMSIARQMDGDSVDAGSHCTEEQRASPAARPAWTLRNFPGKCPKEKTEAEYKQITHAMLGLIENAQHSIMIEHAYLSDQRILKALEAAMERGVSVVILRSQPESPGIEAANSEGFSLLKKAWRRAKDVAKEVKGKWKDRRFGRFLRRHRRAMRQTEEGHDDESPSDLLTVVTAQTAFHSKAMIVDETYVLIGSANCSQESLSYTGEQAILMVRDPDANPEQMPTHAADQVCMAMQDRYREAASYEQSRHLAA